ncbi:hypothetical protein BGX34_002955 [Mortierella sp. NVP85]|nr:hypothetical protein BGX34_002955 [Mortierella sp. NVP85]
MLIKNIILTFAVATIAYAEFIPRTKPNPGGCKDGFRLKKGCAKDGTDICCPVKPGRHSLIKINLGISIGIDGCDCGDKVKIKCKGCGKDDEDKCREKCKDKGKGKGKDKDCVASDPEGCPATHFACDEGYGGNCCPNGSFCGTAGPDYGCYT